jgi:hypothetical protein
MTDTIAVALITAVSAASGLCLKRWWDTQDHRRAVTDEERDTCERCRIAFREVCHLTRSLQQSICMVELMRTTNPEYAMARLSELAHEAQNSSYLNELRDYVEGRGEKPNQ